MSTRGSFLFVESNTTGTGALFIERASALGFEPYLATRDRARYRFIENCAARLIDADTRNLEELIRAARGLGDLAGVYSSSEYYVEAAARVAAAVGLPAADPDAIAFCRNKWMQAERLRSHSVRVPATWLATKPQDVEEILADATLPVVVKPASGSGSSGVCLCEDLATAMDAFHRAMEALQDQVGLSDPQVLVQEFVGGPEYSAEIVACQDEVHCLGILSKHKGPRPHFVEVGHDLPAPLDAPVAQQLALFAAGAVSALGLNFGPAHVEFVVAESGPVIIEVNPRLAGGMIPGMLSLAAGSSIIDTVIDLYTGATPAIPKADSMAGCIRFRVAERPGKLTRLAFKEGLEPTVSEAGLLKSVGEDITIYGDFRDRIAFAIGIASELDVAAAAAERMIGSMQVEIEPATEDVAVNGSKPEQNWALHPDARKLLAPRIDLSRDARLLRCQAAIDEAHVIMLADQGLIVRPTACELLTHVSDLQDETFRSLDDRDAPRGLYLAYEAELASRAGPDIAGWLHLARSRNDLNATISLMVLRQTISSLAHEMAMLQAALLERAEEAVGLLAPLYSQYQVALPGSPGHYLLGVLVALGRERQRLHGLVEDLRSCPLGAGAGGGTSVPIDPRKTAGLLGFDGPASNSLDAVASRDFHLQALSLFVGTSIVLSRLAQDIQVWTTREFAFIEMPRELSGGSSMLPQKKNPFLLEHIKGAASTVLGAYVSAATAACKSPFSNSIEAGGYGTSPLDQAEEGLKRALILCSLVVKFMSFNVAAMRAPLEDGSSMTALAAERMAARGMPFRSAHTRIAKVAARLSHNAASAIRREELADELADVLPSNLEEAREALQFGGGPASSSTTAQIELARTEMRVLQLKWNATQARWAHADCLRKQRVREFIGKR